jgi:DNA polymerase-3 subunit gamma/tau
MSDVLHLKYRPADFADIIGQDAVCKSVRASLDRDSAHTFMLTGPSGVGKTTLARAAALYLHCPVSEITEVNAARFTGIDDMRALLEVATYHPLGKSDIRALIIDECHMLSKAAWNSLLKPLEEPSSFVYWFLCTTEPGRVPKTIMTRCQAFTLHPIKIKLLRAYIEDIARAERIKLDHLVMNLIVNGAGGSVRQALVNLEKCRSARTTREAHELLRVLIDEDDAVIVLCRTLAARTRSWRKLMECIAALPQGTQAESVRIVVANYFGKALLGTTNDTAAQGYLAVLEAFETPYNTSEGMAPLMLSIGRCAYGTT